MKLTFVYMCQNNITLLVYGLFLKHNQVQRCSIHYFRYNKLSRQIRELARKIKDLDQKDPFRTESSAQLLEKL
jgi:U3 small nucleolar ribonucleoprotein protein IMP3